jgi:hypothetical protein
LPPRPWATPRRGFRDSCSGNGRGLILRDDLPLTKGLRHEIAEAQRLAGELELQPLLTFLADAGVPGPLDEMVREKIPRLMAATRSSPTQPTRWELERAARILNLSV